MTCICCRWYVATYGIFCEECNTNLTDEEKQHFTNSFGGQCALLSIEVVKFKQAVKASFPRWLKWMVRT